MDEDRPAARGIGMARAVVLLCSFGLATVGAFTAFFATQIAATLLKSANRPGLGVLILCALVPVAFGAGAVALALWAKSTGKVVALGCGTLLLGMLITIALVLAAAA
jgi:apolipoprotein N-acyltransferase